MGLQARGYDVAAAGVNQWNGVALISRVGLDDIQVGFPDMPGWGDPAEPEARAIGATCGGVRIWSLYVPNGRKPDDPHYVYKLDWLARLREAAHAWQETPTALVGDWNICPTDDDVFDVGAVQELDARDACRARRLPGPARRRLGGGDPRLCAGLHLLGLLPAAVRARPRAEDRLRPRLADASPSGSPARSSTATSGPARARPTTRRSSSTSAERGRERAVRAAARPAWRRRRRGSAGAGPGRPRPARSTSTDACGCSWTTDAGQDAESGPSTAAATAAALAAPGREQQQVPGPQDGAETLGQDVPWHLVDRTEEPCVVLTGLVREGLDPGQ